MRTKPETAEEIRAAIKASLAESKAQYAPPTGSWDHWPAGWMARHNFNAGEGRRRSERRAMRRQLRKIERAEHCTTPTLRYCDCDWCRFLADRKQKRSASAARRAAQRALPAISTR